MKESTLLKVSLISALVGILILFVFSSKMDLSDSIISGIDQNDDSSLVKINGVVTEVSVRNSTTIINVAQLDKISVFVFNSDVELIRGDYIEVTGKMQEYEGKTSLIADKIVLK